MVTDEGSVFVEEAAGTILDELAKTAIFSFCSRYV